MRGERFEPVRAIQTQFSDFTRGASFVHAERQLNAPSPPAPLSLPVALRPDIQ